MFTDQLSRRARRIGAAFAVTVAVLLGVTVPASTAQALDDTPSFAASTTAGPVSSFTAAPAGLTVTFDGSASTADGTIASYYWVFGNGQTATTTTPTTSHTYTAAGTYTVAMRVTDARGFYNSTSRTVTVTAPNQPPVPVFTATVTGKVVTLDASGSTDPDGTVASYYWTFGDGTNATGGPTMDHTYTSPGTYSIAVRVTDNRGAYRSTARTVTVEQTANILPTPRFTSTAAGQWVTFDASTSTDSDGSIVSYYWVFGDGTNQTTTTPKVTHKYPAGRYTVAMRATDDRGGYKSVAQVLDVTAPAWMSGASGPEAVDGSFAAWRGTGVGIVGTWVDNNQVSVDLWHLQPGAELDAWHGPLDVAVGAIGEGETWAAAATGAYDARWRQSLTNLKAVRAGRGTTYIRFAHEMNGNWYPWSVTAATTPDFIAAWKRYRALQQEIFPEAQLVFCANRESIGTGIDWRQMFPGRQYVDVLAVDFYNQYPWTNTTQAFTDTLMQVDQWGAPKGLEQHRLFAEQNGLPFAISEWSNNAEFGDAPVFFEQFHAYLTANAGTGAGKVLYEVLFNINKDTSNWHLYPASTRMPISAETYRNLW